MKWMLRLAIVSLLLWSCGGKLSDEQRQRIRQDMKEGEIRKVTEAAFMDAAFAYGRTLKKIMEERDRLLGNQRLIDSIGTTFGVVVRPLREGNSLTDIEKQLLTAYQNVPEPEHDNVQRIPGDSILYTWPILVEQQDTIKTLALVGAFRISNKQIILSIEN